jgi:hypothetical protein
VSFCAKIAGLSVEDDATGCLEFPDLLKGSWMNLPADVLHMPRQRACQRGERTAFACGAGLRSEIAGQSIRFAANSLSGPDSAKLG